MSSTVAHQQQKGPLVSNSSHSSLGSSLIIGSYLIDRTIGQGTYGKVRLGFHIETNEKVCILLISWRCDWKMSDDSLSTRSPSKLSKKLKCNRLSKLLVYKEKSDFSSFFIILILSSFTMSLKPQNISIL